MFVSYFQKTLKCIKIVVMKNNVTFISLMMFYNNRKEIMFRVLGSIVYTIIDNLICLYYVCLFQDKLSKHNRNFEKISTICLGWGYLDIKKRVQCYSFYTCWSKKHIQQVGLEHGFISQNFKIKPTLVSEADKSSKK